MQDSLEEVREFGESVVMEWFEQLLLDREIKKHGDRLGELRREFEALLVEINRILGKVEEVEVPARISISSMSVTKCAQFQ